MAEPDRLERPADVAALEAEIVRLNKVVDALMDRVEESTNVQGSDFGLFQTTIMLQDQVRLHTAELEAALGELEQDEDVDGSAAGDMQTLRRTAALQIQLLELVVQQKDVGELVERVATILEIPIVLFDTTGNVVCAAHTDPALPDLAPRLWAAYARQHGEPDPAGSVTSAGERVFFRDILVMGRVERVLAAVIPRRQASKFAGASLLFLQQLVTLNLLRGRDELRMRRRLRRGLLQDVFTGDGTPDELRVRLQAQGFDDEDLLRVVILEPQDRPAARSGDQKAARHRGANLLHALDAALSARRMPYLSTAMGPRAAVLTVVSDAEPATARGLLVALRAATTPKTRSREVIAGCSAAFTGVAGAKRALQQATAACLAAHREQALQKAGVFEELSGVLRLLDGLDPAALRRMVQRTFGPILEYDASHRARLFETLRALFDHGLAVQATADALHIHRNTLQKRLGHVEHLLSIDLSDLDAIVDVRLGLHAAELLDEPLA
jgi:sugar diacid utilization regulator